MADNKWSQPDSPPPPLFVGQKEKNLVKQVNDELIERIIGQQVLYYAVDAERTNYHPVYGEAINKTFLSPIRVYALVEWEEFTSSYSTNIGIDQTASIVIHFHKRRLTEDQDLYVRPGDFVLYSDIFLWGARNTRQLVANLSEIENFKMHPGSYKFAHTPLTMLRIDCACREKPETCFLRC